MAANFVRAPAWILTDVLLQQVIGIAPNKPATKLPIPCANNSRFLEASRFNI